MRHLSAAQKQGTARRKGEGDCRSFAAAHDRVLRRERCDRPPVPTAGRNRYAFWDHNRFRNTGRKRSQAARYRYVARAGFDETRAREDFGLATAAFDANCIVTSMKVEVLTLCDAATVDAAGKLNILGAFDRLNATAEPITHPHCALAVKLRFERIEAGHKKIRLTFVNADGAPVMPPIDGTADVRFQGPESSAAVSFALNIQQLKLPGLGEYSIDLAVDGRHEGSVPLFVFPTQPPQPSAT